MPKFESRQLKFRGCTVSKPAPTKDDDCPVCGATPKRTGTTEDGDVKIRRWCPECSAFHWELIARLQNHDAVLDDAAGGAA